ncbi:MAG: MgtC/SapB family protein, partial [Clostridia bacterium]|nr:MgtC/SapB family protein [Clostridia bacterium]
MFRWDSFLYETIGEFDFLIRLLVACICGALVGYERTRRQKEAGIRTHLIVALGSALLMMISKYAFIFDPAVSAVDADMSRIASNVVTGVSFLGAGVIFVRGATIKGLTTAAGIWAVAAVGLAVGAGLYTLGVFVAILLIVIQILLHKFVPSHTGAFGELSVLVEKNHQDVLNRVKDDLATLEVTILNVEMTQTADGTRAYKFEVRLPTENIT